MRTAAFLLSAIWALTACGDAASFETKREASLAVGEALCTRTSECGDITTDEIDACVDLFVNDLCAAADCNAAPVGSNDAINSCIDALSEHSCDAPSLPAECNSII